VIAVAVAADAEITNTGAIDADCETVETHVVHIPPRG
jgi:hypothetical protein